MPATLLFLAREADAARIYTEWLVKLKATKDGDMIIVEDEYCVPKHRGCEGEGLALPVAPT